MASERLIPETGKAVWFIHFVTYLAIKARIVSYLLELIVLSKICHVSRVLAWRLNSDGIIPTITPKIYITELSNNIKFSLPVLKANEMALSILAQYHIGAKQHFEKAAQ